MARHFSLFTLFAVGLVGVLAGPWIRAGETPSETGLSLVESVIITLAKDPVIQLQEKQVEISRGFLETQTSFFDIALAAASSTATANDPLTRGQQNLFGDGRTKLETHTTVLLGGLTKLYRNGWQVNPTLTLSRSDSDNPGDVTTNNTAVSLEATYPLLRGHGQRVTTANERSGQLDYEASRKNYKHTVSSRIVNTAMAYFNYVSAQEAFRVLQNSEDHAQTLVQETKRLIEADEVPPNEALQLLANLADKKAARIASQQNLFNAKQSPGLAMGIDIRAIIKLAPPSDTYPDFSKWKVPTDAEQTFFINEAIKLGNGLKSSELLLQASQIQQASARNALKPKLDFSVNTGYNALEEGSPIDKFFSSFLEDPGYNASVSLNYQWTLKNRSARGAFRRNSAVLEQNIIQTDDLKRTIASNVLSAIEALRRKSEELKESSAAIKLYQSAIDNEKKKFRLGFSTLIRCHIAGGSPHQRLDKLFASPKRIHHCDSQFPFSDGHTGSMARKPRGPQLRRFVGPSEGPLSILFNFDKSLGLCWF